MIKLQKKKKECKIWWSDYKNKLQNSIKDKITS